MKHQIRRRVLLVALQGNGKYYLLNVSIQSDDEALHHIRNSLRRGKMEPSHLELSAHFPDKRLVDPFQIYARI